ncbi:MAG: glycogen synthase [Spirochaetales bacterium]|nr:glycogen synthase [Spirochaetales bacterium]
MKALFLTNEYPPNIYGGAGIHVKYLSQELCKKIPLEVRCFGNQDVEGNQLKVWGVEGAKTLLADTPDKLKSPLNALIRSIQFNTRETSADVVHCHTWYSHFGGILAKMLYGCKLVITTHSLEPLRPWKEEQIGSGYHLSSWVEDTALKMADAVIAVSKETRQDILDYFDIPESKIHVIPNGIDLDEYQKTNDRSALDEYQIPQGLEYVLFVGRVTRQKGIIHLVNAIEKLDPHIGVVLLAGAPDTREIGMEMEAKVKAIQKKRGNIFWIQEMLPVPKTIQFYSHASLFCCPSIYEPFGIINLEAMACETPVVASAVGGIKEVVLPETTGRLIQFSQLKTAPFEPVNPEEFSTNLAKAINDLMADPETRKKMSLAGRKRVEDIYSWKSVSQRVLELYEKLLS